MARHQLDGAIAKDKWSADELHALNDEVGRWLNPGRAYGSVCEFHPEANICVVRIATNDPPSSWAVRAGNIIHAQRSALDYLVWQLVILNGRTPKEGRGGNQFPILTDPPRKSFRDYACNGPLRGVSRDDVASIEELQPYATRDEWPVSGHPLTLLQKFSNIDKHQLLQIASVIPAPNKPFEGELTPNDDAHWVKSCHIFLDSLKDGAIAAWAEVIPCGPNPQVDMKFKLRIQVVIDDARLFVPTLVEVGMSVSSILDHFSPRFIGLDIGPAPKLRQRMLGPDGQPSYSE